MQASRDPDRSRRRTIAMLSVVVVAMVVAAASMPDSGPEGGTGIIDRPSSHSVRETVARLERILRVRGLTLFAVIDHSGEAATVGLKMPDTKLLIFGNPKAGTRLMLAAPTIALDLPLKLLVWEDRTGKVWISYNSPEYLRARHHLPQDLVPTIAVVDALAREAGD